MHRGKGYAQEAMRAVQVIHDACDWELDTILQEKGNCYLYEKMGDEEKAAKYRTKLEIVRENAEKDRAEAELSRREETKLN